MMTFSDVLNSRHQKSLSSETLKFVLTTVGVGGGGWSQQHTRLHVWLVTALLLHVSRS